MPAENKYAPLKKIITEALISTPAAVPESALQKFCNGKMLSSHDEWTTNFSNSFTAVGGILLLLPGVSLPRSVLAGWLLFCGAIIALVNKAGKLMIEREKQDFAQRHMQQLRNEAGKLKIKLSDVKKELEQPYPDETILRLSLAFIVTGAVWSAAALARVLQKQTAAEQAAASESVTLFTWLAVGAIILSCLLSFGIEYKTKQYGPQRTAAVNKWLHQLIDKCIAGIPIADGQPDMPLAGVDALPSAAPSPAAIVFGETGPRKRPSAGAGTGLAANP